MNDSIELYGNAGTYIMDGNVLSFQIGEGRQIFNNPALLVPQGKQTYLHEHQWLGINGYQITLVTSSASGVLHEANASA